MTVTVSSDPSSAMPACSDADLVQLADYAASVVTGVEVPTVFGIPASEWGARFAGAVRSGRMTPEAVGDIWVALADQSHGLGESFIRGYDAAGGIR